jgi:putative flippase GtrA
MIRSAGGRTSTGSPSDRPAVVEQIDSPQSTSDGRATTFRIQVGRFAAIGLVSTLAWAGLFSLLRGAGLGSVAANGIALIVTAIGNTAANRRFTFGRTDRSGLARDHGVGLLAFVIALAITTIAATMLDRFAPHAARIVEITVLVAANLAATAARFLVLRAGIGGGRPVVQSAG